MPIRSRIVFGGLLALLPLAVVAVIAKPAFGVLVMLAPLIAVLASRSIAYPVALTGVPTLVIATLKYDPFPPRFVVTFFFAWTLGAIGLALIDREVRLPLGLIMASPILFSVLIFLEMVARLPASKAIEYGTSKTELYLLLNLTLVVAGTLIAQRAVHFRLFIWLSLTVAILASLLLLLSLLRGDAVVLFPSRLSVSPYENPIQLGRESGEGLLIATFALLAERRAFLRAVASAALPLLVISLFATGSRGPVLGTLVGLVVLLALVVTDRSVRRRLVILVVLGVAAAILVAQFVPGQNIGRSLSFITSSGAGVSSNGRFGLWSDAFNVFAAHPILGIGTGGFFAVNGVYWPHNLLLEVAAELGLVGLILLVVFLGSSVSMIFRARAAVSRNSRLYLQTSLVAALFAAFFVNALVSADISSNASLWLASGLGLGLFIRTREVVPNLDPA